MIESQDRGRSSHRPVRRPVRRLSGALAGAFLALLAAAVPAGAARPDAPAVTGAAASLPPVGTPHPSVPGMFYFGEHGWGRLTFDVPPAELRTVLVATPWYSDATSRPRIPLAERLLGHPVVARTTPLVPDEVDGWREGCRYLDRSTGAVVGYDDAPCEHRNKWARGPQDGFSFCVYKRCQTTGHGSQGGWSTFLAHSELWARVESFTPPPVIGFVPCGPACASSPPPPSTTPPTTPPTSVAPPATPPTAPPTSAAPPTTPPTAPPGARDSSSGTGPGTSPRDPCTLPGVDCERPVCGRDGDCVPRCGTGPCPPPSVCETSPDDAACSESPGDLAGVSARVVISVPEVFVARGVLEPQSVRVTAVELRCDGRPCPPSLPGVDQGSLRVRATLALLAPGSRYRACPSPTSTACEFRVTTPDEGPYLQVDDRLEAVFFTPTRGGEWLRVSAGSPVATLDVLALLPVRVWERTDDGFVLVPTGATAWGYARTVQVPLVVMTSDGATVGRDGLRRLVIGTVGG